MVRDNVKSVLYGMQAVLPHLQARGDGTIANVSSMLGRVPFVPFRAAYSASQGGDELADRDAAHGAAAEAHPAFA